MTDPVTPPGRLTTKMAAHAEQSLVGKCQKIRIYTLFHRWKSYYCTDQVVERGVAGSGNDYAILETQIYENKLQSNKNDPRKTSKKSGGKKMKKECLPYPMANLNLY